MEYTTERGPFYATRMDQIPTYRAWQASLARTREWPVVNGYVVRFMTRSSDPVLAHDGKTAPEMVFPGAFAESIAGGADIKALLMHEDALELGSRDEYSLELREDGDGLLYRLAFDAETRLGRLLFGAIDRGCLAGLSWRFTPRGPNGVFYSGGIRTLISVNISEISFVLPPWRPAYRSGTASLDVPVSALRKRLDRAAAL